MLRAMILYHFSTSPFARRVRLVLAYKGLDAELRDPRADPQWWPQVQRLNPMHTVPVLVDAERVVADSTAIVHYLDSKFPEPSLFPRSPDGVLAFELAALANSAIETLVNLGIRVYELHDHPDFPKVRDTLMGRTQRALDAIAERVLARGNGVPLCGDAWGWADIVVYTLVNWLEGLPERAKTQAPAQQVTGLGWKLPPALSEWADQHRSRADVLALG